IECRECQVSYKGRGILGAKRSGRKWEWKICRWKCRVRQKQKLGIGDGKPDIRQCVGDRGMSNAQTLIARCRKLGAEFFPTPDGRLKVRAQAPIPGPLLEELKNCRAEVLSLLTRPHINEREELIIPFESDPKYHWWKPGGQSIAEILLELNAPPRVWRRY